MRLTLPSSTKFGKIARESVRAWLNINLMPVRDWDLVVSELFTNAVHAARFGSPVELRFEVKSGSALAGSDAHDLVECEVTNQGAWALGRDMASVPLDYLVARFEPDRLPHGRGLKIVSALTSGGEVRTRDRRTSVRVWRELDEAPIYN